jgi:hypothetical protein
VSYKPYETSARTNTHTPCLYLLQFQYYASRQDKQNKFLTEIPAATFSRCLQLIKVKNVADRRQVGRGICHGVTGAQFLHITCLFTYYLISLLIYLLNYLLTYLLHGVRKPSLYRLLTFPVQILVSLFHCLCRTDTSFQVRDFLCEHFVTRYVFFGEELLAPYPTPQAGGPSRVGCPRLLIQYIRNYPLVLEAVTPSANKGRAMPW